MRKKANNPLSTKIQILPLTLMCVSCGFVNDMFKLNGRKSEIVAIFAVSSEYQPLPPFLFQRGQEAVGHLAGVIGIDFKRFFEYNVYMTAITKGSLRKMLENKFNMSLEQNIFWAKRNIVDYIWKSARLEGINITFPQTYAIIEKASVSNVTVEDILKITNLKHAWQLLFDTINEPLNFDLICSFHKEVAKDEAIEWGKLRTGSVFISGTDYVPPVPQADKVKSELRTLLSIENPTERAIEIMLWGMKSQLFWDGNKRNSMLVANKIMIENGCGVISVPNNQLEAFNKILSDYYTNNSLKAAKEFVFEECISGTVFSQEQNIENEASLEATDDFDEEFEM